MKLLNVGCGGQRPQDPHWYNLDNLRTQLKVGTPERTNLDAEPRYYECDILNDPLPFEDECFDGVLLQHVLEHFTCHEAVECLKKCRRVLKRGGIVLASVPNSAYFRDNYSIDTKENAERVFGEPIHDAGFNKFFDYALFRFDHKQVLTYESLSCLFLAAGFNIYGLFNINSWSNNDRVVSAMKSQLSRRKFSVELIAIK